MMPLKRLFYGKYAKKGGRRLRSQASVIYGRAKIAIRTRLFLRAKPELERLVGRLENGESPSADELLPFLSLPGKEDRFWVNYCLASAFHSSGRSQQAKIFIRRAWDFSGQHVDVLPLFLEIHAASRDVEPIREAYKRLGMRAAKAGRIIEALDYFNAWQYAYLQHKGVDEYGYDPDVLGCISGMAEHFALHQTRPDNRRGERKLRVAHLMYGMTHLNSVIVKNSMTFAEHHDGRRFQVAFFVPEPETLVKERQEAVGNINRIKGRGWDVFMAPDSFSELQSLLGLAQAIHDFGPDILVTNAGLADFRHLFVASLKPAPIVVGLCQGPPPQYISPAFDRAISWTRHPLMDCPVDCSLVAGGSVLPDRLLSVREAKNRFGFSQQDLLLMSCGRAQKFQDIAYWKAIIGLLKALPNVMYGVVGLEVPPDRVRDLLTEDVRTRVRFIGRVKEFHEMLSAADVMVDTYPSGGGMTVVDAMALGIPVVSFKNDYMKAFTQVEWSPAEEFTGVPELIVRRGDFQQMTHVLGKLLTDDAYRRAMAESCHGSIRDLSGNPKRMVEECERVFAEVARIKAAANTGRS